MEMVTCILFLQCKSVWIEQPSHTSPSNVSLTNRKSATGTLIHNFFQYFGRLFEVLILLPMFRPCRLRSMLSIVSSSSPVLLKLLFVFSVASLCEPEFSMSLRRWPTLASQILGLPKSVSLLNTALSGAPQNSQIQRRIVAQRICIEI